MRPHQSYPELSPARGRIVLELALLAWMGLFAIGYGVRALILVVGGGV
jgi:hypothetical protein